MTEKTMINIDGTEYDLLSLSDAAKQQIANLQVADAHIQHLQQQLALAQTARLAYANILQTELSKADTEKTDAE